MAEEWDSKVTASRIAQECIEDKVIFESVNTSSLMGTHTESSRFRLRKSFWPSTVQRSSNFKKYAKSNVCSTAR